MSGYIGLTTNNWIESNQMISPGEETVFWCKKKSFKALKKGEQFYFLKRDKFSSNADRLIVGYSSFRYFDKMAVSEAWEKYKQALGYVDEFSFKSAIEKIYGNDDFELGCIVLGCPVFFKNGISLEMCNIDFSPCIVSGKTITDEECSRILSISRRL